MYSLHQECIIYNKGNYVFLTSRMLFYNRGNFLPVFTLRDKIIGVNCISYDMNNSSLLQLKHETGRWRSGALFFQEKSGSTVFLLSKVLWSSDQSLLRSISGYFPDIIESEEAHPLKSMELQISQISSFFSFPKFCTKNIILSELQR